MNNIVLSGLVKRRDEDQRLSVRHPPHRTPPIVYRFALNKAGNARWQISSKIAVARAPRRVSPSTVPWRPIAEGPPSFDGPRQRHPRDLWTRPCQHRAHTITRTALGAARARHQPEHTLSVRRQQMASRPGCRMRSGRSRASGRPITLTAQGKEFNLRQPSSGALSCCPQHGGPMGQMEEARP